MLAVIHRSFAKIRPCARFGHRLLSSKLESSQNTSDFKAAALLGRLHDSLNKPGTVNADKLLEQFKVLDHLGRSIPLSFYKDAVDIFAQRHDAVRTEILIQLSQRNLRKHGDFPSNCRSRSRPVQEAYDELVSYSLGKLMKHTSAGDAQTFWVRMSNNGFVTSRVTLEKLLDSLSFGSQAPKTEFIEKIHNIIRTNSWDQSPRHYERIMYNMRQHISKSSLTQHDLKIMIDRLDALWNEAQSLYPNVSSYSSSSSSSASLSSLSNYPSHLLELRAARIQCLVALVMQASTMEKRLQDPRIIEKKESVEKNNSKGLGHNALSSLRVEILERAKDEFLQLLQIATEAKAANSDLSTSTKNISSGPNLQSVCGIITEEFRSNSNSISSHAMPSSSNPSPIVSVPQTSDFTMSRPLCQIRLAALDTLQLLAESGDQNKDLWKVLDKYISFENDSRGKHLASIQKENHLPPINPSMDTSSECRRPPKNVVMWKTFESDWIERILGDIVLYYAKNTNSTQSQAQHVQSVSEFASKLITLMANRNVRVGAQFYASWIRALGCQNTEFRFSQVSNMTKIRINAEEGFSENSRIDSNLSDNETITIPLEAAHSILDSLEDAIGEQLIIKDALVSMLCSFYSREGVKEAFSIIQRHLDLFASTSSSTSSSSRSHMFPVASLHVLLTTATACLDNNELRTILSDVENLESKYSPHSSNSLPLLHARLLAHARLSDGFQALNILQKLRAMGAKVDKLTYSWVVTSLYYSRPTSEKELLLLSNPTGTIEYLLREMLRDGHVADSKTVAMFMKLFGKACQIAKTQGNTDGAIENAECYLKSFRDGPYMGHPKVILQEDAMVQLVKACCLAGDEEKALSLLNNMKDEWNITPTALSYEPLLYNFASIKGMLTVAEDVLTLMTNKKVSPSQRIVDAFVVGQLRRNSQFHREQRGEENLGGELENDESMALSDALDRLQDLYNQYGENARPSPVSILALLERSLDLNDVHEARRVVVVIEQLFSDNERNFVEGGALNRKSLEQRFAKRNLSLTN